MLFKIFFLAASLVSPIQAQVSPQEVKIVSLGEFEAKGWVLGKKASDAKCLGQQGTLNSECNQGCEMGGTQLCYSTDQLGNFSAFHYFIPQKCNSASFEKYITPYKMDENERLTGPQTQNKIVSVNLQCNDEVDSANTMLDMVYPEDYVSVIEASGAPAEDPVFKTKNMVWYAGLLQEKAEIPAGLNLCAKNYPGSTARAIVVKTKTVAQYQFALIHGKGSKVLSQEFYCTLSDSVQFENRRHYEAYTKELQENANLPPSKQKNEDSIRNKYETMTIKDAQSKISCPTGLKLTGKAVNLDEDEVSFDCASDKQNLVKLCPQGSRGSAGGSGSSSVSKTGVSTEHMSLNEDCMAAQCYPQSKEWKGLCYVCPKGTQFDEKETDAGHKKGSLSDRAVLCARSI
jgi:hypothetical protein